MQKDVITNIEQLPLMLSAKDLQSMGFSRQTTYQLLNRQDAPIIRIGKRIFAHKDRFLEWIEHLDG